MEEVKQLDNQWEEIAKAQANLNALNEPKGINITNLTGTRGVDGVVIDTLDNNVVATDQDVYNSIEYRKAFMNHVLKGTPIPEKFMNTNQNTTTNTTTNDVESVIPTTVLEKIVEKLEATGMILPLVTRTSYKGGVIIPTSNVKPVATWVSEGAGSNKYKKPTESITFSYYKLRCAVSVSFETSVVTLGVFENTLINNIAEAMTKALEKAIISGTGGGQPTGILAGTAPAPEGQNIEIAANADVGYETLINAEAALPLAYESEAVWCMTKKTFMKFVGMTDKNGQPIARVNYGIAGRPERTLLGRTVVLNDYMTGATIGNDTVVAFLFNFKDYVLNTNYNITIKRYEDNDTDDQVTKALMLADGKVVDNNSLVTITKKVAGTAGGS